MPFLHKWLIQPDQLSLAPIEAINLKRIFRFYTPEIRDKQKNTAHYAR